MVLRNQGIQALLQGITVGRLRQVEVQPGAVGADLPAGDGGAGQGDAQQMQAGVHAHQRVAAGPVQRHVISAPVGGRAASAAGM